MRRNVSRVFVLLTLVAASAVLAANPHFVGSPTFSASGGALTATGKIAGIGNQSLNIVLEATGTRSCRNRGGHVPPGQTRTVSGEVSDLRPDNGQVSFSVTTASVGNCPDGMQPTTVFSSATLTVFQGGRVVLQQTFTG